MENGWWPGLKFVSWFTLLHTQTHQTFRQGTIKVKIITPAKLKNKFLDLRLAKHRAMGYAWPILDGNRLQARQDLAGKAIPQKLRTIKDLQSQNQGTWSKRRSFTLNGLWLIVSGLVLFGGWTQNICIIIIIILILIIKIAHTHEHSQRHSLFIQLSVMHRTPACSPRPFLFHAQTWWAVSCRCFYASGN